jgi:hypothetical protein
MNRYELVRMFVLSDISDDYEEPEHISSNVRERAGICGMEVQVDDIRNSLHDLVESGLAKAYRLTVDPPEVFQGMPPIDQFLNYYFWITEKGLETLSSKRDQWPLDEEDVLLPGWSPPPE